MRTAPVIETSRLRLEIAGPMFAERIKNYFVRNREHLEPWEPPRPLDFYTSPFWTNRSGRNLKEFESGLSVRFVVLRQADPQGEIVAMCNFNQIFRGPFLASMLGYSLDSQHVGHGLMTEALRAGIHYVFTVFRLHRIMANYIPSNHRSAATLARLGFQIEGYAREYLFIHDGWKDHVLTSLTNPEPIVPGLHEM